jgi:hypothetical protein
MSKTKTQNEAPPHKYFTQMLNMAEDDLDPFQYRLLAHYIRWTGNGGAYEESIRQTAKATRMGVNKVQSTLDELSELGYLQVYHPTTEEARNGKTISITVLDRWIENINRYQRPVSEKTQAVSNPIQGCIEKDTPPVSNQIRLEEQNTEEHIPRKRVKPYSKWQREDVLAYYALHTTDLDALVEAWGYMTRYKDLSIAEAVVFAKSYTALETEHFSAAGYSGLVVVARAKEGWKHDFSPLCLSAHITDYREGRLQETNGKENFSYLKSMGITRVIK